jgi:dipeptidyl aminopeptidase/acylaminoacyl peptidase
MLCPEIQRQIMKSFSLCFAIAAMCGVAQAESNLPYRLAFETYRDGNWEIFTSKPDGSDAKNLTNTAGENELYPQVSSDGKRIAYVSDKGEGRDTVRSIWIMDADGKNRKKVTDYGREPFWSPDGKELGFLEQEYPKFNVVDYYTKGMKFYNLETGKVREHPNAAKLHHLYNPGFVPNGKWIVSTVHAGMGFSHAILAIEANGDKIINLGIPGCRPTASPDSKHIAWGPGDHELAAAEIDFDSDNPKVGNKILRILDSKNKVYHIDWSPDGNWVSFSRGPDGEGDISKKSTHQAACEIVGVYAGDWNIYAVPVSAKKVELTSAIPPEVLPVTKDGMSNKESDWYPAGK